MSLTSELGKIERAINTIDSKLTQITSIILYSIIHPVKTAKLIYRDVREATEFYDRIS